MAKTKKSDHNHYELLFIIPNNFTEDEAKKIDTNIESIIKDLEGEITHQEYWGKKRLAYEINHHHYGYYSLLEFDLLAEKLTELNRVLKLSNEVLRHQIIKRKKRNPEEIEAEKVRQEKTIRKEKETKDKNKEDKKQAEKGQPKEAVEDKIKKESKEEEPEKSSFKSKEKKIDKSDLKDLDKRLEGILDSKDLI